MVFKILKKYLKKLKSISFKPIFHECFFEPQTLAGKQCDYFLNSVVLLSTLCLILETSFKNYDMFFLVLEWLFTLIFTIEYALKMYSSKDKQSYISSFFGIIDLIAILPTLMSFFLPGVLSLLGIKNLRFFRLLRIFKFLGYLEKIYF